MKTIKCQVLFTFNTHKALLTSKIKVVLPVHSMTQDPIVKSYHFLDCTVSINMIVSRYFEESQIVFSLF